MADPVPRLVIHIDDAPDPISGEFLAPQLPPRRFTGWLELVGLIEQSRAMQLVHAPSSGQAQPRASDSGKPTSAQNAARASGATAADRRRA